MYEKCEWTNSKQEAFDKTKSAVVEVARPAHPRTDIGQASATTPRRTAPRNATGEPGADEDLMCYARASERTGACATATQPTPLLDMSREQHVSRAGGGEVTDSQGRHSQSDISLNDIRPAQAKCPETIILRQGPECAPGAKLPLQAEKEGLVPDGMLCLKSADGTQRRIHIPIVFRRGMIQRAHFGPHTGHHGKQKTINGLRSRLIWGTLTRDVKKALKTCFNAGSTLKDT
ncbi:hypothetical protein Efla_004518 [Eimeria flavescens]